VWRYDLGEQGMLGDAGANPAGAVVGLLLLKVLAPWAILTGAVLMIALNLASERVSFSRVIEGNRLLAWADRLGRVPVAPASGSVHEARRRPPQDGDRG
jgi:hypothetical protein